MCVEVAGGFVDDATTTARTGHETPDTSHKVAPVRRGLGSEASRHGSVGTHADAKLGVYIDVVLKKLHTYYINYYYLPSL